jgi:hypothetical protein
MKGKADVNAIENIGKAGVFAVVFGLLAALFAAWWDNGPDAIWPSQHPVLFGGIFAAAVFVIGLLVIIAVNTSRSGRSVNAL